MPPPPPTEGSDVRTAVFLAVNDIYRIEGVDNQQAGSLARIRALRAELENWYPDLLMVHAGDFLSPSFLSRMYYGKQMVDVLNLMDGDPSNAMDQRMFVVFGNHEFDQRRWRDASLLARRINESQFRWLGSNVGFVKSSDGTPVINEPNIVDTAVEVSGGIRIGLFGLTIPTTGVEYVQEFRGRLKTAQKLTSKLRQEAEVVIAVTHLNAKDDRRLLADLESLGPDLILGGHDHQRMKCEACGRLVLKADADARTATIAWVTLRPKSPPEFGYCFRKLSGASAPPDPAVKAKVDGWLEKHDKEFCAALKPPKAPGCLKEPLGCTDKVLVAEESEIRSHETSLGNWITDQMRLAFSDPKCKAQVAFINSGSLRLNQDLPAGTKIQRRHLEELFGFPAPLYLLRIKGETLQQVVQRSITGWPGSGNWLQISGFSFTHNAETKTVSDLMIDTPQGKRKVEPGEEILAVTNDFLVDPSKGDQDGYTMLNPNQIDTNCGANGQDLKKIAEQTLLKGACISPDKEGRINQMLGESSVPCLPEETDR